jgi:hypothetical protein
MAEIVSGDREMPSRSGNGSKEGDRGTSTLPTSFHGESLSW